MVVISSTRNTKQHSSHLSEVWFLLAPSEEREFVVDFGTSMRMLSSKDLNSAEMEHCTSFEKPNKSHCGKWRKCKQARMQRRTSEIWIYSWTMHLLKDTPPVLSLGQLCEDGGYSYEWIGGQKPHLLKNDRRVQCNAENYVPIVVRRLLREEYQHGTCANDPLHHRTHRKKMLRQDQEKENQTGTKLSGESHRMISTQKGGRLGTERLVA